MAETGRETTIQLPPPAMRPRGLFVDVAEPLPPTIANGKDRLGMGVQHIPWGCEPLLIGNADCTADYILTADGTGPAIVADEIDEDRVTEKDAALGSLPEIAVHPAFKIVDGLSCSTLWQPDATSATYTGFTPRLLHRMKALASAVITAELISGWASNGVSLSDAVDPGSAGSMDEAAQYLEEQLAVSLQGQRGTVFIPPTLLHQAMATGWVLRNGQALETMTGHKVVSDAGHLGYNGPTAATGGDLWLFAAGEVFFRVSDTMLLGEGSETVNISTNMRERLAEAYAQLAFDPCSIAAVTVDVGIPGS